MQLILKLAWRSLWRNKRRTLITLFSMALGVALVVFFESLRRGAFEQLVERAVRMQGGHVCLEHPEYRQAPTVDMAINGADRLRGQIAELNGVETAKILVLGQALVKTGAGAVGVMIVGVEPGVEEATSPLARRLVEGRYLEDGDGRTILIGSELARQLRVGPGKKVVVATSTLHGQMEEQLAHVKGVFAMGTPEIDGYLVQVPLRFAQELYGMESDQATQIGVMVRDPARLDRMVQRIRPLVAGENVAVLGWQEIMPDVASFIHLYNAANVVQKGLLLVLVLFSVFNTLLMSVMERRKEFAVLLALGTPLRQLRAQVFLESVLLGFMGCASGLAAGAAAAYWAGVRGIDLSLFMKDGVSLSGFTYDLLLRPHPVPAILLGVGMLVFGATLLLSLYPLRVMGRVKPAHWLR